MFTSFKFDTGNPSPLCCTLTTYQLYLYRIPEVNIKVVNTFVIDQSND